MNGDDEAQPVPNAPVAPTKVMDPISDPPPASPVPMTSEVTVPENPITAQPIQVFLPNDSSTSTSTPTPPPTSESQIIVTRDYQYIQFIAKLN